jgi:hypothetical protein
MLVSDNAPQHQKHADRFFMKGPVIVSDVIIYDADSINHTPAGVRVLRS